jgi:6-phosphogluconate dehydrogenase
MQIGMVGLGRMGSNLVQRLLGDDHECVVFDVDPRAVKRVAAKGATGVRSLADLVASLAKPRAVWVMVPAGAIAEKTVNDLAQQMGPGDVIIDGGNSYYRDDIARAATLREKGIHYLDVGTSGGVWGLERGYCLMIGGEGRCSTGSAPCSSRSPRASKPRLALPDVGASPPKLSGDICIAGRRAPDTSSRWSTTASSTA